MRLARLSCAAPGISDADGGAEPHLGHFYGGQAVIEGVMMRGAGSWAVAVRRPSGEIYVEQHPVSNFPERHPIVRKPMIRGCFALFDALSIGVRALTISANQSMEEEDKAALEGKSLGGSLILAFVFFTAVFIVLPNAVLGFVRGPLGDGAFYHLVEGVFRIVIFLAYLSAISLMADIRRVFQYHGAEHKTIAAWEHDEPLEPSAIDRYSTLHVRCGTNFLLIVMILALVVYSLAGAFVPAPADPSWFVRVSYHVGLRVVLLPVVAGLAYEGIRLGASRSGSRLVGLFMVPGLWLQRITTRQPTEDQIEVAIRAFERVVPQEVLAGRTTELPSSVVTGPGPDATPLSTEPETPAPPA